MVKTKTRHIFTSSNKIDKPTTNNMNLELEENKGNVDDIIFGDAVVSAAAGEDDTLFLDEPKPKEDKNEVVIPSEEVNDLFNETEEEGDAETKETTSENFLEDAEEKAKESSDKDAYKNLVTALVESGEWDFDAIEDEDGNVIQLSEMDIDEETYIKLKDHNKQIVRQKIEEEIFSDISDAEKEFLEFKKTGGDLDTFVKSYKIVQNAQSLDTETDEGKVRVIKSYYLNLMKKSPEWVDKYVNRLIETMEIDSEAEEAKAEIVKFTEEQHANIIARQKAEADAMQAAADEAKAKRKEEEEAFKKSIETELKAKSVHGKKITSIIKGVTERDEKGLTELDRVYLTLKSEPNKLEFLWDALTNPDNFASKVAKENVNKANLNTFKTLKFNPKSKNKATTKLDSGDDEVLFNLN